MTSDALSRRSLFIGEPGNREEGLGCSNGMTFSGSNDGSFSLKTDIVDWDSGMAGRWSIPRLEEFASLIC